MSPRAAKPTPASLGFMMPAEWDRHEATWLAWPHNKIDWPDKLEAVRWGFAEMVRKIAHGEIVRILVQGEQQEAEARAMLDKARADLGNVVFHPWPTTRGWIRDFGPIGIRRSGRNAETAVARFKFTAWGYKHTNWQRDNRVSLLAAGALNLKVFTVRRGGRDFALEGGGIDVNGRGTILATEECFLHPTIQVRNPGATREDYEAVFRDFLGARNTLWLGRGIAGDDTHGHVDDLCRFVRPDTVVLAQESNPKDVNYRPLKENRERLRGMRLEDGSKVRVVELPCPAPLFHGNMRLPASYANFYIANTAVLVPTFNDPQDRVALGILADLFPDRTVTGIHAVDFVLGSGTVHCLTQQQPAAR
jgi:agmatine deiminase